MINANCWQCKHYWGAWQCAAFPEGIPEAVQRGTDDHRAPIEGDGGIQFEPISASFDPAREMARLLESDTKGADGE